MMLSLVKVKYVGRTLSPPPPLWLFKGNCDRIHEGLQSRRGSKYHDIKEDTLRGLC